MLNFLYEELDLLLGFSLLFYGTVYAIVQKLATLKHFVVVKKLNWQMNFVYSHK